MTATRAALLELATRVEQAISSDWLLSANIALVAGWIESEHDWISPGWKARQSSPPHYTHSLDTALTLVPRGRYWSVCNESQIEGKAEAEVGHREKRGTAHVSFCATPSLALCAAALRALAAEAPQ